MSINWPAKKVNAKQLVEVKKVVVLKSRASHLNSLTENLSAKGLAAGSLY